MKRKLLILGSVILCGIAAVLIAVHFNQRNWNPVTYPLDHSNFLAYGDWEGKELRTVDNKKSWALERQGPSYHYPGWIPTYNPISWIEQKRYKRTFMFRVFITTSESETRPLFIRIWKRKNDFEEPPTEYIDVPLVKGKDGYLSEPILFLTEFETIPGVHTLLFGSPRAYAYGFFHTEGISPINSD